MKIHFSIDDVIKCLLYLTQNNCKSIFESYVFDFAKKIWNEFGIYTTCNCMFECDWGNLAEVSSRYREQFQENSEWLRFSFHCLNADSNYGKQSKKAFIEDYRKTVAELERIVGCQACDNTIIRLHLFAGNDQIVDYLSQQGTRVLLTADDMRNNYDLTPEDELILQRQGVVKKDNLVYLKTDYRVESNLIMPKIDEKFVFLPMNVFWETN